MQSVQTLPKTTITSIEDQFIKWAQGKEPTKTIKINASTSNVAFKIIFSRKSRTYPVLNYSWWVAERDHTMNISTTDYRIKKALKKHFTKEVFITTYNKKLKHYSCPKDSEIKFLLRCHSNLQEAKAILEKEKKEDEPYKYPRIGITGLFSISVPWFAMD